MRIVPDRFCGKFLSSEKSRLEVTRSIWSNFGLPEAGLWSRSPYWVADRHAPPSATCSIFFTCRKNIIKCVFGMLKTNVLNNFGSGHQAMEVESLGWDFVIFAKPASGAPIGSNIGIWAGIWSKTNGKHGFESGKWCENTSYSQKHCGKHFGGMGELAGGASLARNPKLSDFQDLMSLIKTVVTTMTATLVETGEWRTLLATASECIFRAECSCPTVFLANEINTN